MSSLPPGRLASLDAFRGITIAGMMLVNKPGSWEHVHPPLLHAEWHGCTPTDLIFPFFLFIMGVAMELSLRRRSGPRLYARVLRRAAILFALGLWLALFPDFDWGELRVAGVLQRIAVAYLVAAPIVAELSRRAQVGIAVGILLGYWALMTLVPVPGHGAGVLTPEGNLAAWVDERLLPGRAYRGTWDPEGLLSTLPAIATVLLGALAGRWLRSGRDGGEVAAGMFTAGWVLILAGLAWDPWFPINKQIWTSSYVLFTGGAALQFLAACYWLVDVRGHRRWAMPAIVYGLNPIAIYVLSTMMIVVLDRLPVGGGESLKGWLYGLFLAAGASPVDASLAFAMAYVTLWWAIAALLHRRGIYIKV